MDEKTFISRINKAMNKKDSIEVLVLKSITCINKNQFCISITDHILIQSPLNNYLQLIKQITKMYLII